jgi:phage terminase large subunit-like protein
MRVVVHHPRSGLLVTSKPGNPCDVALQGGSTIIKWRNGSRAEIHTSEEPDRARGPEYDWGLADEVATWKRVVDFAGNTTWTNLEFGLRGGKHPQMVAGTTPRRGSAIVKELVARATEDGPVRLTRGSTLDNRANLPKSYLEEILGKHGGTHLGRQEIEGELLPDVEGAIVTIDMIENDRRTLDEVPELQRIAIGVDPSGGTNEQGIIACGLGVDGHGYVLRDRSGVFSPEGWARRTIDLYGELAADVIVAERNYGGDMVESTIRSIDPRARVKLPTASRGKHVRFEPIGSLYEQHRIHHCGMFERLEDEVTAFTPTGYDAEGSPNRADALVWALSELMLSEGIGPSPADLYSPGGLYDSRGASAAR